MTKRYNLRLTKENQEWLEEYKEWLRATLNIFPGDTVCLNSVLAAGFAAIFESQEEER